MISLFRGFYYVCGSKILFKLIFSFTLYVKFWLYLFLFCALFLEFHTLCEIKENRGAHPKFHTCVKLSGSPFLAMKMWQIGYVEDFRKQKVRIYKNQSAFFGKFSVPSYWFGRFLKVFLYFLQFFFSFENQHYVFTNFNLY